MAFAEKHYRWTWHFKARPDALWPFVSNTDKTNRDCGFPAFEVRLPMAGEPKAPPGVRRLRSVYLGMVGEWEEREFEWVQPVRFAVERRFSKGPISYLIQSCGLAAADGGGTTLTYQMRVRPSSLAGAAVVPVAIGFRMPRQLERVFRGYDLVASQAPVARPRRAFATGTQARMARFSAQLTSEAAQPADLVERLCTYVSSADDFTVAKMRPYALADAWGTDRRATLDLFLHSTRAGMLDFSWEVLCPHCRGSKPGRADLSGVTSLEHCDSCGIDFAVNFDQSVELTFVPNPTLRPVSRAQYCLGGPQITPHIVAQKHLEPRDTLMVAVAFPEGRYRVRAEGLERQQALRIERGGAPSVRFDVGGTAPADEPVVAPDGILNVVNAGAVPRLVVIERTAWGDQAVTAAAVTSRQVFRDLFSREILRQGERISVGSLTIVFTDLKNSTQLYREIGDAPAFGRVMGHFDLVKAAVAAEGGAVVKTMGDAVMATFTHPGAALKAMRKAQAELAKKGKDREPFALKCAIHQGACLAINQNERLDYFGTSVNICARLCALSTGQDIIITDAVREDPEVAALEAAAGGILTGVRDSAPLKGIGGAPFDFWRMSEVAF